MKTMQILAAAAVLLVGGAFENLRAETVGVVGLPPDAAVPSQTTVTIRSATNASGVVSWSTAVALQFPYTAAISAWGSPVRQGTAIKLDFTAVKSTAANAAATKVTREAAFGALDPGTYTFTVTTRGLTVATQAFTVPFPPPVVQNVTLAVNSEIQTNVRAVVHVDFGGYYALKSQSPVTRDSTGRFVLEATVEPVAVIQVVPMPPFPKLDLTYALGAVNPGTYGIVFRMNGKTFKEGNFTIAETPPPIPVTVTALATTSATGTTAVVRCVFPGALVQVADDGSPVLQGQVVTISLKATVIPTFAPVTEPTVFEKAYPLGKLAAGNYSLKVKIDGLVRGEFPFVVPVVDPPPPPEPRLAFAEAHLDTTGAGYVLDVGIVIPVAGKTITDWGTLSRDGKLFRAATTTGNILVPDPAVGAEMSGDPVFQGQGFVVAAGANVGGDAVAVQLARHSYALPSLEPGEYAFEATVDGKPVGRLPFTIAPLPPPPEPVVGAMEISKSATGNWIAKVTVILPKPDQIVSDWGSVAASAHDLSAKITIGTAVLPPGTDPAGGVTADGVIVANGGAVLPAPRPVFSHQYDLGVLAEGDYSFALLKGDRQLAIRYFKITATPPPPPVDGTKLAFIEIKQGDASTAAEVGILLPAGRTVTSWGEALREGSAFKVTVIVGPATVDANAAQVERHVFPLGVLGAGEYKLTVCWQDALATIPPVVLGARIFKVVAPPPPPPGPGPLPIVAFLEAGKEAAGTFVDLGIVFPCPGQEVKNWGTPSRDGTAFKTTLVLGPVDPTVPPGDPPSPPVVAADGSVVNVRVGEPLPGAGGPTAPAEIGGWPVKPVVHRYPLGPLDPGQYSFAVCVGNKVLARRSFWVRPPSVVPPPVATVRVDPISEASAAAHPFRILFNAAAGWQGDPTLARVTVTGPDGTVTEATRVGGGIISLDPLGRLAEGSYTLAAPGGDWNAADNGKYKICVDLSAVKDRQGRTLAEPCVGGFVVNISPPPPPPPPTLKADLAIAMVDGKWNATVTFDNTGGWFRAEWGTVRVEGTSFLTFAELIPLPAGSLAPIPASFSHVYDLGELKPGSYLFVFRSSAGHAARAKVEVAGVEPPTALEQWKFNALGAAYLDTAVQDDLGDPDGNGVPTLVEFALGGDPAHGRLPEIKPEIILENGVRKLGLHFRRPAGTRSGADCLIEVSKDMKTWVPAGNNVEIKPSVFDIDGSEDVSVSQTTAVGISKWPFMRIRVVKKASD